MMKIVLDLIMEIAVALAFGDEACVGIRFLVLKIVLDFVLGC